MPTSCVDRSAVCIDCCARLRSSDVKSGHLERKVQALENERDQWESKYEEMSEKYKQVKKELDEFAADLGNL